MECLLVSSMVKDKGSDHFQTGHAWLHHGNGARHVQCTHLTQGIRNLSMVQFADFMPAIRYHKLFWKIFKKPADSKLDTLVATDT